jgi:hypothetical protein
MRLKSKAKGLQAIPGIGPSLAGDLEDLGYAVPGDLKGEDPQEMYDRLERLRGAHIDRCVLYTFRCAVYFADNTEHDPELLKWWNWKDVPGTAPVPQAGKRTRKRG